MNERIISLRAERNHFIAKADKKDYVNLFRDTEPGTNVYWNGFGEPPTLSFRADFDDKEFNRKRQGSRDLVKGRFSGGNVGWIVPEDMELFAGLYRKPLKNAGSATLSILDLIEHEGGLNIQQIKEETGFLVKEITPILHKLQEAFLVYEDQYDGEWDRGWCAFTEMFPDVDVERYTRHEALMKILPRFAYRNVFITSAMAKSFYRLPEKEIKAALSELTESGIFSEKDGGYILKTDLEYLESYTPKEMHFVYALHRNDFLYKSNEHILKEKFAPLYESLPYDHEPLQYLFIDGAFHGITIGHFRNGPYDLNDIICDLDNAEERKEEILEAVREVNFGKMPERFMGKTI